LALKPNYADAFNNLGIVYREAKNTDAAIAAFKRAAERARTFPTSRPICSLAYRDVVPPGTSHEDTSGATPLNRRPSLARTRQTTVLEHRHRRGAAGDDGGAGGPL